MLLFLQCRSHAVILRLCNIFYHLLIRTINIGAGNAHWDITGGVLDCASQKYLIILDYMQSWYIFLQQELYHIFSIFKI